MKKQTVLPAAILATFLATVGLSGCDTGKPTDEAAA